MDLNADLGESWYDRQVGNDADLMPYLDSCNVACGLHGGDALTQLRTIELALHYRVAIGAHPSFPDRKNFGRRVMQLDPDRLSALLVYQVGGLSSLVRAAGATLHHLKPHGALYHYADQEEWAAHAIAKTAELLNIAIVYGPPGGKLEQATQSAGLEFWAEGFVDRVYEPSLRLRSREEAHAIIEDPTAAAEQARQLAVRERVKASDGNWHSLSVQTLCIHGDHPGAVARAKAIRAALS